MSWIRNSLKDARDVVLETFGQVDILINGAGGNKKEATTTETFEFFDIPADGYPMGFQSEPSRHSSDHQVFGEAMAKRGEGVIITCPSMNSFRPLTRIVAYSAAKAAVNNFTQWMAVHFNLNYSKNIRVNAIAPGFSN